MTREFADRNGAVIEANLDEDLPLIPVSPIEVEQVIINLLHNAIQAGEPGSLVRIRTRHSDNLAMLTVEDSGRGMTEEEQQHAFDPFFTTRQSVGGTGLGMSIIFGIVQDHGDPSEFTASWGREPRLPSSYRSQKKLRASPMPEMPVASNPILNNSGKSARRAPPPQKA